MKKLVIYKLQNYAIPHHQANFSSSWN